jgi:hypothetical protein
VIGRDIQPSTYLLDYEKWFQKKGGLAALEEEINFKWKKKSVSKKCDSYEEGGTNDRSNGNWKLYNLKAKMNVKIRLSKPAPSVLKKHWIG